MPVASVTLCDMTDEPPSIHPLSGKTVGVVEPQTLRLELPEDGLRLQHGGVLPEVVVAYEACGFLNPEKSNVIFVCHALTGDAHVAGIRPGETDPSGWWEGMVGSGRSIDTDRFHVICANIIGGCKGTTGPSSINPATGRPYGSAFPHITVGDMVKVNHLLLKQLGINRLAAVIGGSFGGMGVLEWAVRYPEQVGLAIVIASAARLNPQALAFDIIARQSITRDPSWKNGDYYPGSRQQLDTETGSQHDRGAVTSHVTAALPDDHGEAYSTTGVEAEQSYDIPILDFSSPVNGLASARKMAHLTYLSAQMLDEKFGREEREEWRNHPNAQFHDELHKKFGTYFQIESYLNYQGEKFVRRFDANSYLHLTRAMDEFDLANLRLHSSLELALAPAQCRTLVVSLSGDWLFTPDQSEALVSGFLHAQKPVSYCRLVAPAGHDAFLTHIDELSRVINAFLQPTAGIPGPADDKKDPDEDVVLNMLKPGCRILDLGCGSGGLLTRAAALRGTVGTGVEIKLEATIRGFARGVDIIMQDIDDGFGLIPRHSFDTVILSSTLQVIQHPEEILLQLLNVGGDAIITFPNFGHLPVRLALLFTGRMPKARALPYEWYDTPNIHLFTLHDFLALCAKKDIRAQIISARSSSLLGRILLRLGFRNQGADRIVARITPGSPP